MMLCEIGLLDTNGKIHKVDLKEGLNIITGNSSTGKSALLNIVDYCFASSRDTIPNGLIKDRASIYYVVIKKDNHHIVLGRNAKSSNGCYFSIERNYNENLINQNYFHSVQEIKRKYYQEQLNRIFIPVFDVDVSEIEKKYKGKKSPAPSVRSFMSFMLQYQNVIANQDVLFCRFNHPEKREQVIEHTKIFLGFVNQEYFLNSQKIVNIKQDIKLLSRKQDLREEEYEENKDKVEPKISLLCALMGMNRSDFPEFYLDSTLIEDFKAEINNIVKTENIDITSDGLYDYYIGLDKALKEKERKLKEVSLKIGQINHSLEVENNISMELDGEMKINQISDECIYPFCHSESKKLSKHADLLRQAINKVNDGILKNKALRSELELAKNKVEKEREILKSEVKDLVNKMKQIKNGNSDIQDYASRFEQAIVVKLELFDVLKKINAKNEADLLTKMEQLDKEKEILESKQKKFNVNNQIDIANKKVNQIMRQIGQYFDFDESYLPINLKFSFENFELYHERQNGEKVYFNSMGSAAHYLYSHLTLFLALHQYFIESDEENKQDLFKQECLIPSILMIDQPTQVYFPNFKSDISNEFNKERIKELERNPKTFDEDIQSVTNIFKQLAIYCRDLKEKFGYSPQIIVTDHVDRLDLGEFNFEDFVQARWRERGFIEE